MPYVQYYDNRYGDYYEVYYSDEGEFESAVRSTGEIGRETIYYDLLSEIPPFHRNNIEHLIWRKTHPQKE